MAPDLDESVLREQLRRLADHRTSDLAPPSLPVTASPLAPLAPVAPVRSRRSRSSRPSAVIAAAAAVIVLVVVVGAVVRRSDPGPAGPGTVVVEPPSSTASTGVRRYRARATVLENAAHGPELCFGGIQDSYPPGCGGPSIANWDWTTAAGSESAGGTTWGGYEVVGTYDGTTFTLTEPPRAVDSVATGPTPPLDLPVPCPVPAGGWPAPTWDGYQAMLDAARQLPSYAGLWIVRPGSSSAPDPGAEVVVVRVAGDVEDARRQLGGRWSGPLCVVGADRTLAQLIDVQNQLTPNGALARELGIEVTGSSIDEVDNRLVLLVVSADDAVGTALDQRFGPGAVHVSAALEPLP